jgi:hypothetical protein
MNQNLENYPLFRGGKTGVTSHQMVWYLLLMSLAYAYPIISLLKPLFLNFSLQDMDPTRINNCNEKLHYSYWFDWTCSQFNSVREK